MANTQVLISGAGPTGLVLALWLKRLGVTPRIIDKTAGPGTTSRALAVQARTLELYDQLGLAQPVTEQGVKLGEADLTVDGAEVARIRFGELGQGLSPFPFGVIFPQDEHERLLVERLAADEVEVERRTELLGFEQTDDGVRARLKRPDGSEETCEAAYLVGCDGAHSTVRHGLKLDFPGGDYAQLFYVADVRANGPMADGRLHIAVDAADFLGVFPMKGEGRVRLVGAVRETPADRPLGWEDVSRSVLDRVRMDVEEVNWFSTYHVHHRVARRFKVGRAFIAGDAAHIHSPVGGQGMNTGIGDAINLAWKVAEVQKGRAAEDLLESYEPERIAFARRLVATTDQVFTIVSSEGPFARRIRTELVPPLLGSLFGLSAVRRFAFRTVSQIQVNYRHGPLAQGAAGDVRGGDRLPYDASTDNFAALRDLRWQAHVYGRATPELRAFCDGRDLDLREFPWRPETRRSGLQQDALYLVRPDGYVALAVPGGSPRRLAQFVERWKLSFG